MCLKKPRSPLIVNEYSVRGPSQRRKSPLRDPGPKNPEEKSAPSPRAISESWSSLMHRDDTRQSSTLRVIVVPRWRAVPVSTALDIVSVSCSHMILNFTCYTYVD